jgi:hypothetical protein
MIYEVDIFVRDKKTGDVVHTHPQIYGIKKGEVLEVWVNDRLKFEEEWTSE